MQNKREEIIKRYNSIMELQQKWTPKWKEVSDFILPERGLYDGDEPTEVKAPDYKKIIDDTATSAAGILMAGLMSGLTPQNKQWFKLAIRGDDTIVKNKEVRLWLDFVENMMSEVFNNSNVYEALPHIYEEDAVFGTAAAAILFDPKDVIRLQTFTAGEYALGVDFKGQVNTFARSFWQDAGQMVEEFGFEKCPSSIQDQYKNNNLNIKTRIFNLVCPNYHIDRQKQDNNNMPFISYYWIGEINDKDKDGFLDIRGYKEFPFMTPRWKTTTTGSCYGIGCGMRALGNIKSLQRLQKDGMLGVEKSVNPPVQINAARGTSVDLSPGGKTYVSIAGNSFGVKTAYEVALDLQGVQVFIADMRARINRGFYSDLFLMVSGQGKKMTAKEVAALQSEQLLQLGPVFQKMTKEGTNVLINRTFNIMLENNLLPPPPQVLEGQNIEIEYVGLLAQAQQAAELASIGESITFASQVMAINPEVADLINWDFSIRQYFQKSFMPAELLKSEGEVAQIRQARQKAQQEAQQQSAQQAMIDNAEKLSKAKTDTPSLLTELGGDEEQPL